ncbi:MAG TPA: aminopeptidase [Solirubrobacteraceae bacterium]|nr:aminopeptidase [Solirubrobacteraceae bacterium]
MTKPPVAAGIDPDAFATLLCDWCLELLERDTVLVSTTPLAQPLVRAFHRAAIERGAWPPGLRIAISGIAEDFYRHAPDELLDNYSPQDMADAEQTDAFLSIQAPANTRALAGIDPAVITRAARALEPVREVRLGKRWCGTIWPTAALAQQAGMSDDEYAGFVNRALFLDRPDPVAAWRELSDHQASLVDRLSDAREIRIEADGTDLRLGVEGRTWINSNGRRNMPSGEVFTGPLEDSATGTIRFTIPSSPRGVLVEGVELAFEEGRVTRATADRGQSYLDAALGSDPGARFLGELGIGTNVGVDRPTGSTLLDEKMAGTVHLALGRSYPETGGRNVSSVHWDLICDLRDGGRLSADGEPISV